MHICMSDATATAVASVCLDDLVTMYKCLGNQPNLSSPKTASQKQPEFWFFRNYWNDLIEMGQEVLGGQESQHLGDGVVSLHNVSRSKQQSQSRQPNTALVGRELLLTTAHKVSFDKCFPSEDWEASASNGEHSLCCGTADHPGAFQTGMRWPCSQQLLPSLISKQASLLRENFNCA